MALVAPDEGSTPDGMLYPPDLAGRRAVVTGAAKGIGRAIAEGLIAAGAEVIVVDRDRARLVEAYDGRKCSAIVGDIRRAAELAEQVLASGLVVDLIVNNVGVSHEQRFHQLTGEDYEEVFDTNVRGPLFFTQRLMEDFRQARERDLERGERARTGAIVFVSSVHSGTVSHDPLYSMTKAAIDRLACELAAEYRYYGMRVNVLSPGWIRTSLTPDSAQQQAKLERMQKAIPMGVPGQPSDALPIALLLLSDAYSGYVNGANVRLDGGLAQYTSYRVPDGPA
jgi:NAD(P)-dependent dehydrogenase (short-subunit alcohol dehydrogenase family)